MYKILVAMDTSTIGKSVFDELLPWQRRIQSHAATFCPLRKGSPICVRLEYYSGLSGKTLEIYGQWKTFEEHGLELLRTQG